MVTLAFYFGLFVPAAMIVAAAWLVRWAVK